MSTATLPKTNWTILSAAPPAPVTRTLTSPITPAVSELMKLLPKTRPLILPHQEAKPK